MVNNEFFDVQMTKSQDSYFEIGPGEVGLDLIFKPL